MEKAVRRIVLKLGPVILTSSYIQQPLMFAAMMTGPETENTEPCRPFPRSGQSTSDAIGDSFIGIGYCQYLV